MALKKKVIQDDGVTTEYHRILYVQSTVNSHCSVAVISLVSEEIRRESNSLEKFSSLIRKLSPMRQLNMMT